MSLKGRNALVTGGSRGIGAQIVLDLAKQGANVLFNYVSPSSKAKGEEVIKSVEQLRNGATAHMVEADVGSESVGQDLVKAAKSAWGEHFKSHILVHNAGISVNAKLEEITMENYKRQMAVNVQGPIFITQAFLPHIPKHAGGRIIMLSSVSARAGPPHQSVYACSKISVEQLCNVWTHEFGQDNGIAINAINPGPVETDMWNANTDEIKASFNPDRIATPSQISDIIVFLASDQSRWVQGSTINANGGLLTV